MDRAARQQRLGVAVKNGQAWVVERMLEADPDLPLGNIGLACCFYLRDEVARSVAADPEAATRKAPMAPPLTILAQSHAIHILPRAGGGHAGHRRHAAGTRGGCERGFPAYVGSDHMLSTLYFAVGHADNMPLAKWLLEHGADPNDGESLYHSTELGHHEGLRLLLSHGADPKGTNALLRAMDFHDIEAVQMLMAAGAEVDEFNGEHVGGERPWVVPRCIRPRGGWRRSRMAELLLDAGASATREFEGVTPYSMARVYGNRDLARLLEDRGAATRSEPGGGASGPRRGRRGQPGRIHRSRETAGGLSQPDPVASASALEGHDRPPARLVALGVPYDTPDAEGLTPVQIAGWEGLPDIMAYLLSLKPDLAISTGMAARCCRRSCTGRRTTRTGRAATTSPACVWRWRRAWHCRAGPSNGPVTRSWPSSLRTGRRRYPGQVVEHGVV
jgi:hypothetical protein